jgi:hypothetical protein
MYLGSYDFFIFFPVRYMYVCSGSPKHTNGDVSICPKSKVVIASRNNKTVGSSPTRVQ